VAETGSGPTEMSGLITAVGEPDYLLILDRKCMALENRVEWLTAIEPCGNVLDRAVEPCGTVLELSSLVELY
jgi:hypothetical protein